jgi:hypothetical protein
MSITYLTGTRYPGSALKSFLPDYIDVLLQRGESLLTTNKPGVDALIVRHCDQHNLPLQVIEFACDSGDDFRNRRVKAKSEAIQVQRVVSPSWLRFRHLADKVDKMIFFHGAKTRGRCYGLPTTQAFEQACQRRGVEGEQLIIQRQHTAWVSETELRNSPTIGAAHIYLYARFLPGLEGERHGIGYYRIETWRRIAGIIQPGEGRREIVMPNLKSKVQANLHMLHQALRALDNRPPERLIIHHNTRHLDSAPHSRPRNSHEAELRTQVRALLDQYPQVVWQIEQHAELLQHIGKHISQGQELWYHKRRVKAYKGLYQ